MSGICELADELHIQRGSAISLRKKIKCVIWIFPVILLLSGIWTVTPAEETSDVVEDGFMEILTSLFSGEREKVVGKNISPDEITEFYYTYDSSTDPPEFQRYRFYIEDGTYLFYHETRKGDSWPLREDDITVSGTMELSEEEWEEFCSYLEGGHVRKREESLEDGDAGPWCYLYWKRDRSEYQEFSFASWEMQDLFEEFCLELKADSEMSE